MVREIKFRGKSVATDEWVYGYLLDFGMNGCEILVVTEMEGKDGEGNITFVSQVERIEVDPETVGQFTGLKDINDKEIYEDDIICISDTYTDGILDDGSGPSCEFNHLAKVVFVDGAFGLEIFEDGDDFYRGFWSFISIKDRVGDLDIIVVGNIHDNPELLQEIK